MTTEHYKIWWRVKGKITSRYGSVTACANAMHCSVSAIRKAVEGECPNIATKLKTELKFDWETKQTAEAIA